MSEVRGFATPFRIERASGGVAQARGAAKVRENLIALVRTQVGERFMRRDYGGGLRDLVHEPLDEALHALVERRIAAAVVQFEPRVTVEEVLVERRGDQLVAELGYRLQETGDADHVEVPIDATDVGGR